MTKKPTEKLKSVRQTKHLPDLFSNFTEHDRQEIGSLIEVLDNLRKEGYEHLFVVFDPYRYSLEADFFAESIRDETDEEFEARVLRWQEQQKAEREMKREMKAKREERDRKEFERLKKKFGSA